MLDSANTIHHELVACSAVTGTPVITTATTNNNNNNSTELDLSLKGGTTKAVNSTIQTSPQSKKLKTGSSPSSSSSSSTSSSSSSSISHLKHHQQPVLSTTTTTASRFWPQSLANIIHTRDLSSK